MWSFLGNSRQSKNALRFLGKAAHNVHCIQNYRACLKETWRREPTSNRVQIMQEVFVVLWSQGCEWHKGILLYSSITLIAHCHTNCHVLIPIWSHFHPQTSSTKFHYKQQRWIVWWMAKVDFTTENMYVAMRNRSLLVLINLIIGFVTYPKAFGTLALTQSFGISSSLQKMLIHNGIRKNEER